MWWFSREAKEVDLGSMVPRGSSISDCRHRRHSFRYSLRGSSKLNWTPTRFPQPAKTSTTAQQSQWSQPRPKNARCSSWPPSRTTRRQSSSSKTMLSLVGKNPHLSSSLSRCCQHWTQVAKFCSSHTVNSNLHQMATELFSRRLGQTLKFNALFQATNISRLSVLTMPWTKCSTRSS